MQRSDIILQIHSSLDKAKNLTQYKPAERKTIENVCRRAIVGTVDSCQDLPDAYKELAAAAQALLLLDALIPTERERPNKTDEEIQILETLGSLRLVLINHFNQWHPLKDENPSNTGSIFINLEKLKALVHQGTTAATKEIAHTVESRFGHAKQIAYMNHAKQVADQENTYCNDIINLMGEIANSELATAFTMLIQEQAITETIIDLITAGRQERQMLQHMLNQSVSRSLHTHILTNSVDLKPSISTLIIDSFSVIKNPEQVAALELLKTLLITAIKCSNNSFFETLSEALDELSLQPAQEVELALFLQTLEAQRRVKETRAAEIIQLKLRLHQARRIKAATTIQRKFRPYWKQGTTKQQNNSVDTPQQEVGITNSPDTGKSKANLLKDLHRLQLKITELLKKRKNIFRSGLEPQDKKKKLGLNATELFLRVRELKQIGSNQQLHPTQEMSLIVLTRLFSIENQQTLLIESRPLFSMKQTRDKSFIDPGITLAQKMFHKGLFDDLRELFMTDGGRGVLIDIINLQPDLLDYMLDKSNSSKEFLKTFCNGCFSHVAVRTALHTKLGATALDIKPDYSASLAQRLLYMAHEHDPSLFDSIEPGTRAYAGLAGINNVMTLIRDLKEVIGSHDRRTGRDTISEMQNEDANVRTDFKTSSALKFSLEKLLSQIEDGTIAPTDKDALANFYKEQILHLTRPDQRSNILKRGILKESIMLTTAIHKIKTLFSGRFYDVQASVFRNRRRSHGASLSEAEAEKVRSRTSSGRK